MTDGFNTTSFCEPSGGAFVAIFLRMLRATRTSRPSQERSSTSGRWVGVLSCKRHYCYARQTCGEPGTRDVQVAHSTAGLFDQVPCLRTRSAVIVKCFTRTGRRVLLCHCPAGMRSHGDILISLWLDRYAVKQAPRSWASFPDPLPSSAGGLSGPQVSARNACDKLQQEIR